MKRSLLLGLVAAVAAIVLLLALRDKKSPATPVAPDSTPAKSPASTPGTDNVSRPALPGDTTGVNKPVAENSSSDTPFREYVRDDGTLVRDHRTGVNIPDFTPQTLRPPGARKVPPEVIIAVRNAMRPIVHRCAESLSTEGLGPSPRLQSQVTISIFEGHLSVDAINTYAADVSEKDADTISDCIKTPMQQLILPAQGQDDISEYVLTLPFRLKPR